MNILPWQTGLWHKFIGEGHSLPHALLLKGRKGIGKLDFARYLAASLLCESPQPQLVACGHCVSCNWFAQESHPDFRLIEPGTGGDQMEGGFEGADRATAKKTRQNITVGQIRALAELINVSTHRNGYRIILVHPAEAMNVAAANALLKSLEEPPPRTLFILVSHRPQQLLPTIVSRCRQVAMPIPDVATSESWLQQQGVENALIVLAEAGYAPVEALGRATDNYRKEREVFIDGLKSADGLDPLDFAEKIQQIDLRVLVGWLQEWCYDLMSYRLTGKIRYHLDKSSAIAASAGRLDVQAIDTCCRKLVMAQRVARHPLNAKLFLEEILFDYAKMMAIV